MVEGRFLQDEKCGNQICKLGVQLWMHLHRCSGSTLGLISLWLNCHILKKYFVSETLSREKNFT